MLVDYLLHGVHRPTGLDVAAAARDGGIARFHSDHVPSDAMLAAVAHGILDKAFLNRENLLDILPALKDGDSYCGSTAWGGFASVGSHFTERPCCTGLSMG